MMTRLMNADSRFRFAPSPSGMLHVGGARTALFNWLLARHCGGKLILRIEDTDASRSTDESRQAILDGLTWLGLDWDEGPYLQSQRGDRYRSALEALVAGGKAYPCFCSKDELDAKRKRSRDEGQAFVYDGTCRDLPEQERRERAARGEEHVLRFRAPAGAVTEFDDLIGGKRRFENDGIGDFVIRRSDETCVYQLTVVVDDHEMGITHVVRGDDHLSNTPKQIMIFEALSWAVPEYAHLPLIQGPDRSRLSKRHGATSVTSFAEEGFLPEAMFNFLALLGWSLDAETELMSRERLIDNFSIDRITRSAAIFDRTKLEWMNGQYLRTKPETELVDLARERFLASGIDQSHLKDPRFAKLVGLERERSRTLEEMRVNLEYFFVSDIANYEEKAAKKHFLREGAPDILRATATELESAEPFDASTLEPLLRSFAEREGISFGKVVHPLRLALTGRSASPGIFDVLSALGRESSLKRIRDALAWIERQSSSASTGVTT